MTERSQAGRANWRGVCEEEQSNAEPIKLGGSKASRSKAAAGLPHFRCAPAHFQRVGTGGLAGPYAAMDGGIRAYMDVLAAGPANPPVPAQPARPQLSAVALLLSHLDSQLPQSREIKKKTAPEGAVLLPLSGLERVSRRSERVDQANPIRNAAGTSCTCNGRYRTRRST